MGGGFLADFLLTHTKLSLTAVRKIMTTLGEKNRFLSLARDAAPWPFHMFLKIKTNTDSLSCIVVSPWSN